MGKVGVILSTTLVQKTGHPLRIIADTLKQCAAQQRPSEQRDWAKYADHTVAAVSGERGQREQHRLEKYADAWKRLEGRDPNAEREAAREAAHKAAEKAAQQKPQKSGRERSRDNGPER